MNKANRVRMGYMVLITMLLGIVLSFDLYQPLQKAHAETSYVVGTSTSNLAVAKNNQRKVWNFAGRWWVFYSDGVNMTYSSSLDGVTWAADIDIRAAASGDVFDTFLEDDGDLHYGMIAGYAAGTTTIYYRKGTLSADGSISWADAEQTIDTGNNYLLIPSITVDTSGKPFIAYRGRTGGINGGVYVTASSLSNGTWSTLAGFSIRISSVVNTNYVPITLNMTAGQVFVMYNNGANHYSRLWDGDSWDAEINFDLVDRDDVWTLSAVDDIDGDPDQVAYIYTALGTLDNPPENTPMRFAWQRMLINNVWETDGETEGSTLVDELGVMSFPWCYSELANAPTHNKIYNLFLNTSAGDKRVQYTVFDVLLHQYEQEAWTYSNWAGTSKPKVYTLITEADAFPSGYSQSALLKEASNKIAFVYVTGAGSPYDVRFIMFDLGDPELSNLDSVSNVSPLTASSTSNKTINFIFNPAWSPSDGYMRNATLYVDGQEVLNQTTLSNGVNNTISATVSTFGSYSWYVRLYNATAYIQSSTFTFTVTSPPSPPIFIDPTSIDTTWFMRSDTHTVNEILGYRLAEVESALLINDTRTVVGNYSVSYGFRAYAVDGSGNQYEVTSGVSGIVTLASNYQGDGLTSTTWACSDYPYLIDAVKINLYQRFGSGAWSLRVIFISDGELLIKFPASTWTIYYYVGRNVTGGSTYSIYSYGISPYLSAVDFEYDAVSPWEMMFYWMLKGQFFNFMVTPWTYLIGDVFYGIMLLFIAVTTYNRYQSMRAVLGIMWIFGGTGGILSLMIPAVGLRLAWVVLALALSITLYKLIR